MKLISYVRDGAVRAGIVEDGQVRDAGTDILKPVPGDVVGPLDSVTLKSPVQRPSKVVCVGLNYRDHAKEGGQAIPERPVLFPKFSNSINDPDAVVLLPGHSSQVDYEAEVGVVIGKRASQVSVEDALDYVYGYTCLNDVSARDLQFAEGPTSQWMRGKAIDGFLPVGPHIVTADEIPDPQILGIKIRLNGETLQDSNTKHMIFPIAEIISFISEGITLEPGDLIATGTPEGVGFARKPPIFLKPGDVTEVEVDGIGVLRNTFAAR